MTTDRDLQPQELPSKRKLAQASGIALLVATGVLVTVVLPAEYGVDPLGTGATLGLVALSTASAPEAVEAPAGVALVPVQDGAVSHYPAAFNFDSRQFVLGPYEFVEYKYHLQRGASMFFSWTTSSDVVHDFHGDPDGAQSGSSQSFDKQPRRRADGGFTAPFSGIHGWFWENPGGETITVKVTTAGFYTAAHEFRYDGTRQPRQIRALDTLAVSDNEKESAQ